MQALINILCKHLGCSCDNQTDDDEACGTMFYTKNQIDVHLCVKHCSLSSKLKDMIVDFLIQK